MKVLHISDSYEGGGAEAVLRDTIKVCEELGYQNNIFVSDKKTNLISYVFSIKNYKQLLKKLNEFKPAIIHLHNYYHYLSPSILFAIKKYKKTVQCKVIFTAHDYHIICPNSGFQYFKNDKRYNFDCKVNNINLLCRFDHRTIYHSLLKVMQHLLCYKVLKLRDVFDVIISPSEFLKNTFINYGVIQPITVIRNPVAITKSERKYLLEDNCIHMVFVGRITPEKGLAEFINKINKETKEHMHLHIYGSGESLEMIKSLQCRKYFTISFHGFIDRSSLISEISKYHIFVLPSIWFENAPISIIEATAAGLPILVPNYGGLAEIAKETLLHYEFDYEKDNISELIKQASLLKGNNKLIHPENFSYTTYKLSINSLYTDNKFVD
ncbi:glycosyltransferase family 4 protein [Klebsiella sp. I138]|uniref:glycosyltransferase family 4 protein n=1 Tax=Klebsiella sp. I138 TaxID=2755385 RepID=UPI003DAA1A15